MLIGLGAQMIKNLPWATVSFSARTFYHEVRSNNQLFLTRSSIESEYKALANTAAEITWLQLFLWELGVHLPTRPTMFCANIGATYLSSNLVFNPWTKHIPFCSCKVATKTLLVKFLSSKDQVTDILTKLLISTRISRLASTLNVFSPMSRVRERIETQVHPTYLRHSHKANADEKLRLTQSQMYFRVVNQLYSHLGLLLLWRDKHVLIEWLNNI